MLWFIIGFIFGFLFCAYSYNKVLQKKGLIDKFLEKEEKQK